MKSVLVLASLGAVIALSACGPGMRVTPNSISKLAPSSGSEKPSAPTEEVPEIPATPFSESAESGGLQEIPPEFDSRPSAPPTQVRPSILAGGVINTPDAKHLVETGRLIPTIYYSPFYDEDQMGCQESVRVAMKDMAGNKIMDVCPKTHASCGYQGSCVIKRNNVQKVYNVVDRKDGEDRFAVVNSRCKFGYGVHDKKNRRSFCLEPFVTIAADLSIYNPGDVIYIPKARDMGLPSGRKHDGYFIVADAGRLIKGKGRFDFFSGNQHWQDIQNPLSKIGLNDKDSNLEYHRVEGEVAELFRNKVKNLIAY